MNGYSTVLRYIKKLAEADEYIKTITTGEDIDLNKGNIFPLFNIEIGNAVFSSTAVVTFDVTLSCLDIREINNEGSGDKFYECDNEIDNMNSTLTSLQSLWTKMKRDFDRNNITANDAPVANPIIHRQKNILDGWELVLQIEVPIDETNRCEII